jgi:cysteine synthase A
MKPMLALKLVELVGRTPLLKIASLSRLSQCDIFMKCEFMNPGGSIKDRAALAMVQDAIADGRLKPGMTIVEGTAGNTGIGLAIAAKAFGYKMLVVMPKGQTPEKERMIALHGAELVLVDPCPFKDPKHFYHTARRIAEESPEKFWWANQFENLSNFRTHRDSTGPEILQQMNGRLDALVSAAGTGGTLGGCSTFLKQQIPQIKVVLADPEGSGLYSYFKTGEFKSEGSSLTEGIGIMRLVANFAQAKIDTAVRVTDKQLLTVARYVRDEDGFVLGSSAALNAAAALHTALQMGPGKRIVTFACDLGERSFSKLWNPEYLKAQKLDEALPTMGQLVARYHEQSLG